jgi:predicted small metal-binding protein
MTGYFVRAYRDGKWQSLEIDQLTDEERKAFAESQPARGWTWAHALASWIRDNVKDAPKLEEPAGNLNMSCALDWYGQQNFAHLCNHQRERHGCTLTNDQILEAINAEIDRIRESGK